MPEFIEQVKPTGPEKVPHGESGHRISAGSCPQVELVRSDDTRSHPGLMEILPLIALWKPECGD